MHDDPVYFRCDICIPVNANAALPQPIFDDLRRDIIVSSIGLESVGVVPELFMVSGMPT